MKNSNIKYGFATNKKSEVIEGLDKKFLGSKSDYWHGWIKNECVDITGEVMRDGIKLYEIEYRTRTGTKTGYVKEESIEYLLDHNSKKQIYTWLRKVSYDDATREYKNFDTTQVVMPFTLRQDNIDVRYFESSVIDKNLPNYVGERNNVEILEKIGEILFNKKWYKITAYFGEFYINDDRYAFNHSLGIPNKIPKNEGEEIKYDNYPFKGLHEGIDFAAAKDTEIYSISAGKIVAKQAGAFNYIMILDEDNKKLVVYQHTASISKELSDKNYGDEIKVGMKLGIQGHAGMTGGDHVHLEVMDLDDTKIAILKAAIEWKKNSANASKDYYQYLKDNGFSIKTSKDQTFSNFSLYEYLSTVLPNTDEYTMDAGKSYKLTNNSEADIVVKNNSTADNTFSYQKKDQEGIYSFKANCHEDITISKHSNIIITADNNQEITLNIPSDVPGDLFIIEEAETPAEYLLTLESGKNYEIINNSRTLDLKCTNNASSNKRFDYVKVEENESVSYYIEASSSVTLKPLEKMIVSECDNNSVVFNFGFSNRGNIGVQEIANSPILKHTMEIGLNYEIKNISQSKAYQIKNTSYYNNTFDYVEIEKDGSFSYSKNNSFNPVLSANEKIIMTGASNKNILIYYPYLFNEIIEVKEVADPALSRITMEVGKSYEIKNTSSTNSYSIKNTSAYNNRVDYVKVSEAGGFSYEKDTSVTPYLSPKEKIIMTGVDNREVIIYYPYFLNEIIEVKEVVNPALYRVTMEAGKTFEIKNTSSTKAYSIKNTSLYSNLVDYVEVKENGEFSYKKDAYVTPYLSPKEKVIMTGVDNNEIIIYYPYFLKEIIDVKEVGNPALRRVTMAAGKNFEIINTSSTNAYSIKNTSLYSNLVDYVEVKENGEFSYKKDAYVTPYLSPKEKVIMTGANNNEIVIYYPYFLNEIIEVKEVVNPALRRVTMAAGKTFEIKNTSATDSYSIKNTSLYSNLVDYVEVKEDGELSYHKDAYVTPHLSPKEKIVMTGVDNKDIIIYFPYFLNNIVQVSEVDHSALIRYIIKPGKEYEIKNNSSVKDYNFKNTSSSTNRYNYVLFDENGNQATYNQIYGTLNIKKQNRVKINANDNKEILFYYPHFFETAIIEING